MLSDSDQVSLLVMQAPSESVRPLAAALILRGNLNGADVGARGAAHPGQVANQTYRERERQLFALTITPTGNFESPINLSCMCLECGRTGNPHTHTRAHTQSGFTLQCVDWVEFKQCPG